MNNIVDRLNDVIKLYKIMKISFENQDLKGFNIDMNNFLIQARTITFLIQKRYRHHKNFSEWYNTKREEMKDLSFHDFIEYRNHIEKEGDLKKTMVLHTTVQDPKENPEAKLLTAEIDKNGKMKNKVYGIYELKPFYGGIEKIDFHNLDEHIFNKTERYLRYLKALVAESVSKFES